VPELGGEGVEDLERALAADDLGVQAEDEEENMEQRTRAVPPSGSEKRASMARSTPGEESLADGAGDPGPGGQQAQQRDRVAAHVHHGPAGQVELVADVTRLGQGGREGDVDLLDDAELARLHDLDQPRVIGWYW
jgi:hypothetical protein